MTRDLPTMNNGPGRIPIFLCGLFAVIFLFRLPAILLTKEVLFNSDELEMTFSVLDRFLGIPPTNLAWPGSTLQFIGLMGVSCDFLVSSGPDLSQRHFLDYLSRQYISPWHSVLLLRVVVAFTSSAGFALFYIPLYRFTRSRVASLIGVLVLATLPPVWIHSHMATGDALSLGLVCLAISALGLKENSSKMISVMGILFGLAVASKITVIFILPLVVALAMESSSRSYGKAIGYLGIGAAMGFVIGNPYLWIEPIRFAKSVIGNATRPGEPIGWGGALTGMSEVVSLPALLIGCLAFLNIFKRRNLFLLIGIGVSLIALVGAASRSGVVYERYFLPAAICVALLIAVVIGRVDHIFKHDAAHAKWRKHAMGAVGAVAALGILANIINYGEEIRGDISDQRIRDDLIADVKKLTGQGTAVVPIDLLEPIAISASPQSLKSLAEAAEHNLRGGRSVSAFALSRGVAPEVIEALGGNFTEDEQAFIARLRMMAYARRSADDGLSIRIWGRGHSASRFGALSETEALSLFETGQANVLVVYQNSPRPAGGEVKKYGAFVLYHGPLSARSQRGETLGREPA